MPIEVIGRFHEKSKVGQEPEERNPRGWFELYHPIDNMEQDRYRIPSNVAKG